MIKATTMSLAVTVARANGRRNLISPPFVSTSWVYVCEEGSPLMGVPPSTCSPTPEPPPCLASVKLLKRKLCAETGASCWVDLNKHMSVLPRWPMKWENQPLWCRREQGLGDKSVRRGFFACVRAWMLVLLVHLHMCVCVCRHRGSSKIWGFDFTPPKIRVWKAITLNAHHIKTCMSSFFALSHLRFCLLSNIQ